MPWLSMYPQAPRAELFNVSLLPFAMGSRPSENFADDFCRGANWGSITMFPWRSMNPVLAECACGQTEREEGGSGVPRHDYASIARIGLNRFAAFA